MDSLHEAIKRAQAADAEFGRVLKHYGYRSRWDWSRFTDQRPLYAYLAKIHADEAMHLQFELARHV